MLDSTKEDGSPKTLAAAAAAAPSGGDLSMGGDPSAFSVLRSKTQKNNPVSRWHVGKGCVFFWGRIFVGLWSCKKALSRQLHTHARTLGKQMHTHARRCRQLGGSCCMVLCTCWCVCACQCLCVCVCVRVCVRASMCVWACVSNALQRL